MTPNPTPENPPAYYRKKPVVIQSVQWTGKNEIEIKLFCNDAIGPFEDLLRTGEGKPYLYLLIQTLEGNMRADMGDWIIRGVKGEFYPCKPDIFEATYEPASVETADAMLRAREVTK